MGYSFRLSARGILYAPSHRQDNTYHGLCYTSRGALDGTSCCRVAQFIVGTKQQLIIIWITFLLSAIAEWLVITYIHTGSYDVSATGRKEGNVLFNDALNTFYLRLYGFRHVVKDHSDSERWNTQPPHGLLFPISRKGSFTCTIPQTGYHMPRSFYTSRGALTGTRNSSMGPPHEWSIRRPIAPGAKALTTELHLAPIYNRFSITIRHGFKPNVWFDIMFISDI